MRTLVFLTKRSKLYPWKEYIAKPRRNLKYCGLRLIVWVMDENPIGATKIA